MSEAIFGSTKAPDEIASWGIMAAARLRAADSEFEEMLAHVPPITVEEASAIDCYLADVPDDEVDAEFARRYPALAAVAQPGTPGCQ